MQPLIRFEQVSVSVQGQPLLSQVTFSLYPGQKAVLCGKSGAGKSSVLKTLLGMHPIQSGEVYFQGQRLSAKSIQAIRACTAYVGQEPVLGAETVREALLLPFQFKAHRDRRPSEGQLLAVLQRLQLPADLLNRDCRRISGGEKQRVALGRGLLLGKTVYLLDEVTSGLDKDSQQAVFDVFIEPQFTVLAVAHDRDWVRRSDAVFKVEAGVLTRMDDHGNAGY